ncbi:MAG: 4-hydroxy-tetrahydrodipicolinate synthase [Chlorobi bacterium]|nr:4-hydroxy-tetrahydrodipicolinate synthase [Chlorobiota bacterium]
MVNIDLKGTGVALITPFRTDGSIDFKSLGNIVNHVINNNVNYVVVLGTTSEAATLNADEKSAVVNYVIDTVNNRVPIVIGIGGNNTNQIVSTIQSTDFSNISAILSVSPYYNKPNQKGIYQHYKAISRFSPVPIILYNVPGRTGSNIQADTVLKMANDFSNIIAVKEASGNIGQIGAIIKNKPDNFYVLSGDDMLALPLIALGADGIISVTANAFPKEFTQLINNSLKGDFNTARKYHFQLIDIMHELFADGNPAGIKAALSIKGFITNHLRLPLVPANRTTYNQLVSLIESF